MRCVCTAIYIGPHLLYANKQGGSPSPPPPARSGGGNRPLGSAAGPVLTKLKIINNWWYCHHHKKQNLYLNNIYKLYLTNILLNHYIYTDTLKIFEKELFCSVQGHFEVLWLFETKTVISKVVDNLLKAHFLENKFSTKFPVCLCRLVLDPL
jgi:hypothetical protein